MSYAKNVGAAVGMRLSNAQVIKTNPELFGNYSSVCVLFPVSNTIQFLFSGDLYILKQKYMFTTSNIALQKSHKYF